MNIACCGFLGVYMAVCGTQNTVSADIQGGDAGGRSFIYAGFIKTDKVVMSGAVMDKQPRNKIAG